mgnify:CR=1 FL=1
MELSGVGMGLRSSHIKAILKHQPDVAWFELLTDNWLDASGIDGLLLDEFCQRYPVALHSIAMDIGGCDPVRQDYLNKIKQLKSRVSSHHISDHLCFSQVAGHPIHDLAPIPYTQHTLEHVCQRVEVIQNILGESISIENISAYVHCLDSTMSEAKFLNQLATKTGCRVLLDINNLYVNARNLGRNAEAYIHEIDAKHVSQYHLAGFNDRGTYLLDAHDHHIHEDVLTLYELALERIGARATLIEWDHHIPSFEHVYQDYKRVKVIHDRFTDSLPEKENKWVAYA